MTARVKIALSRVPVMSRNEENNIVFAVPSKGSLYEGTLNFLKLAGVPIIYGGQRRYTALLGGVENISVLFQRAEEIPIKVASGAAHIGLTGEDLFREHSGEAEDILLVKRELGYGHARLVVAVPDTWIDVATMHDLADLAVSFRLRHHRSIRIATKFPNLSREFLAQHGVFDYSLVESLGATESAPSSGAADLIVDLTSSGMTLAENSLKVLKDGTVIASQACLIASRRVAAFNRDQFRSLETFIDMVESCLRGRETYNLQAAVRRTKLSELAYGSHPWRLAYSLPMEEINPAEGSDELLGARREPYVVIRITCPRPHLHRVIRRLRDSGAEEVIVTQPEYVFQAQSGSFQALKKMLKKPFED